MWWWLLLRDAAARAGPREGDIICRSANTEVSGVKEFESVLSKADRASPINVFPLSSRRNGAGTRICPQVRGQRSEGETARAIPYQNGGFA